MKINPNILRLIGVLGVFFLTFIFFKIVVYLTISMVLFLVGHPLTVKLEKLKIPSVPAALITIIVLVAIVAGFFYLTVPPLIAEISFLSELKLFDVLQNILNHYPNFKSLLHKFGNEEELEQNISQQISGYMSSSNISTILHHALGFAGTAIGGILCVLFISFFFLKDGKLIREIILLFSPSGSEDHMNGIMTTSKKMLSKYFAGLFLDMFIVGSLTFLALTFFGVKNAHIIAFCAGIFNMVPYIGSFITISISIVLGVSSCISSTHYELIGPVINEIFFSLLTIYLLDAFLMQPLIFSKSVLAHPLEIFIVTLMAGTIGGIVGMIVALPCYTLIRIVAKEFLSELKFFQRISSNIN